MEVLEAVGARDSALSADLLRTLYRWLGEKAAGEPLVHAVEAEKLGEPSVPFAAVVEAYVLHALRQLGLSSPKIREAAEAVRREFDEPYARTPTADPRGVSLPHHVRQGQRGIRPGC